MFVLREDFLLKTLLDDLKQLGLIDQCPLHSDKAKYCSILFVEYIIHIIKSNTYSRFSDQISDKTIINFSDKLLVKLLSLKYGKYKIISPIGLPIR
jgi:hypothetical protein